MEGWTDNGIVLLARPHGENGAVLTLMTEGQGKHAGFLHGAASSKNKVFSELGHHVHAHWQAKSDEQLGHFKLESIKNWSGHYIDERLKLMAVISACHLCERAIPERENHPQIFHGLLALFEALDSEIWAAAYIMWEIALLKELGFAIDLTRCASGNGDDNLLYVSPKSGRAVSKSAGALYKDKLLVMPEFLKSKYRDEALSATPEDIEKGFALTGFFLENWVFAQHSHGVPDARLRLAEQFVKKNNQT